MKKNFIFIFILLIKDGITVILYISSMQNLEMMEYILEKGYDINHHKLNGMTALINCVYRNYINTLKFLLKYDLDLEIRSKQVVINFTFLLKILFIFSYN